MEELKKFLQFLARHYILLIFIPILIGLATFYILSSRSDTYTASTQITTGIVEESRHTAFSNEGVLREPPANRKFANLIETMRSKSLIDQVSYQLILHDLTSNRPFQDISILNKNGLNDDSRKLATLVYTEKYNKKEALNLKDLKQVRLAAFLKEMGYDSSTILRNLEIFRLGDSDFIHLDYESQNPEVSAFVVNAIVAELIKDYTKRIKETQQVSADFLQKLVRIKADTLSRLEQDIERYKVSNRIPDYPGPSAQVLTDIADHKAQQRDIERNMAALKIAINNINGKLAPPDRPYAGSNAGELNREILNTRRQLQLVLDKQVNSDYDEQYQQPIDSLQQVLTAQINNISSGYITNASKNRENLLQEKTGLQVQYDQAASNLNSVKKHIHDISGKVDELVPHATALTAMQNDIAVITKEYQGLQAQLNQITMESELPVQLRQVQLALPGPPNPSNKMLVAILSAVLSSALCILILLLIFYLDNRITEPRALTIATNSPVLGYLNLIGKSRLDLKDIWKNLHGTSEMREFKRQLRSTRFELSREMALNSSHGQILGITSLNEGEGKTLIAACIAYTYVMISKKVLLIDGNFDNPSITQNSNTKLFIEDYFQTGELHNADFNSGIMVMGNYGGDKSILEVSDEDTIMEKLEYLKSKFDIILVETPALSALNKAKEWISLSDKTIGVFEANQALDVTKKQYIHYLTDRSERFIGWILNKTTASKQIHEYVETATVID